MNVLLVNPLIPDKSILYEHCDDVAKKAIGKRVLVGPPLALNDLAGVIPEENILIIDQKAETDMDPSYNPIEGLEKVIKEFKPDMVSITCLTAQYNTVLKLLKLVKKIDKNILTTIGGLHPSSAPNDFIGSDADIISIGLGKYSFKRIVEEFKKYGFNGRFETIPGLALNRGNSLYFTKSLCEIGYEEFKESYLLDSVLPNRSLTDKYNYINPKVNKTINYLSTSQGCPNRCNFCYLWKMTGGRYFQRDVEAIISELKQMDKYYIIRLCDANTFGDIKDAKRFFERVIEEGLNENHQFMADVRTDTVIKHPEVLELAAKAGLKLTICGLEATTDEELKRYGKDNSIYNIVNALKILNEIGIKVNGNYIVRPDYDKNNFEHLRKFISENPIFNSGLTILTPFPGTEQWEQLKDQIIIKDYDYYNLTNCVIKSKLDIDDFYSEVVDTLKVSYQSANKYREIYGNV